MFSFPQCRSPLTAFLLLLLLLCSCGVHASYSESLAMSALYFSKASYCEAPSINNWSCVSCSKHPSFQMKKVFEDATEGALAYMGVSDDRIVISFRGSENTANWNNNIGYKQVTYPNSTCVGCSVHDGFLRSFYSVRDSMWKELQLLVAAYPGRPVLVTGHSLGGAMAVLAAVDFVSQAYASGAAPQFQLYTFGAPRVGNKAFTTWVAALFCHGDHKAYRVTNKRDVVPHIPPMTFGFEHTAGEVWYSSDSAVEYRNCSDVKGTTCSSLGVEEDSKCSNSVLLPISVSDHLEYLGICTSCSCTQSRMDPEELYELSPRVVWMASLDYKYQHEGEDGKKKMFAELVNGLLNESSIGK